MGKATALIVYGSTLGFTKLLAERVGKDLWFHGWEVSIRSAATVSFSDFLGFDLLLLGSSTWDKGGVQEEMRPLYDTLKEISLQGVRAAVFGVGDRAGYPEFFCKAVDLLESRLTEQGARLVQIGLRQDESLPLDMKEIDKWCKELVA